MLQNLGYLAFFSLKEISLSSTQGWQYVRAGKNMFILALYLTFEMQSFF